MALRVATFNVENLFDRPIAMNLQDWKAGQQYIDDCARLDVLFDQDSYSDADKEEMLTLLEKYGLDKTWGKNSYLTLQEVRGKLLAHPTGKRAEVIATGRGSWVGWVELNKMQIEDEAIANTARVIADVNPDIIIMVEVESRRTLINFHDSILAPMMKDLGQETFAHIMVIQGNDERGINVGIMSRRPILSMVSHVDDRTKQNTPLFSRDCPEYYIDLGDGNDLIVLPNHLASKGSDTTGSRRRIQAQGIKEIYDRLIPICPRIIIGGDFNDYIASGPLDPILKDTDLTDAMTLPVYKGEPGTYQTATAKMKFDYLLLSPALAGKVTAVDVNRKGYYAPKKWESYPSVSDSKGRFNASDHQCLWAEIDL